jgi:hypothetical protein
MFPQKRRTTVIIYVTATATTKELLAQMRRNGVTAPYQILGYDWAKGAWLVEQL